eukprot:3727533-Pleurochrysis_carterae.AAC.3
MSNCRYSHGWPARSAAPQPIWSSAISCLRERRSAETLLIAKAQRVTRPHTGLSRRARIVSNAEGWRERRGYSPGVRRKGTVRGALRRVFADKVGGSEAVCSVGGGEVAALVEVIVGVVLGCGVIVADTTGVELVAVIVPLRVAWNVLMTLAMRKSKPGV